MSLDTLLPLLMIVSLLLLLFSGYPVAMVLLGVTMVFTVIALLLGFMTPPMLRIFSARTYGLFAENLLLPAVAPLLFMGIAFQRSGIAKEMFLSIATLLRRVPGNTYLAVLLMGVLLAPAAGLVGAAVAMLSMATIPSMLAMGKSKRLTTASVAVAGTVGTIVPPGIMLFFLADLMSTTILGAFGGILFPLLLLLSLYSVYFVLSGHFEPRLEAPIGGFGGEVSLLVLATKLVLPILLIVLVLGSIVMGWATPTQSASIGAAGAFLLMLLNRSLTRARLREVLIEAGLTTAMVFFVIIAANAFSLVLRLLGGDELFPNFLEWLSLGDWGALIFILATIFVLGFFIDWIEIVVITLPIFAPVIAGMDFSEHVGNPLMTRIWILTAIAIVLQTSFLTPPFGFALFFLRGTTSSSVSMGDIYKGAYPLVLIQLSVIVLILVLPDLSTKLPLYLINR